MTYPMISSRYAKTHRSEIYSEYKTEIEQIDTSKLDAAYESAQLHNELLYEGDLNKLDPVNNGYYEQLDITGDGIMAYVTIPRINVTLPVFHGTSNNVLRVGAGHMPESSLPVGGINTHSVITAHSGMASEPMFSDLELLQVGDIFQINVLGQTLTYEVYDIPEPVLPQYVDVIQIQEDKDLCTLITCTPYGVNTHRLLIHGVRVPTPTETPAEETLETAPVVVEESLWEVNYHKSLITGVIIAVVSVIAFVVFWYVKRNYSVKQDDEK